jgi:hypothetical protein
MQKAKVDDLTERDMIEIAEFVYSKNIIERNAEIITLMLQLFYCEEELLSTQNEK